MRKYYKFFIFVLILFLSIGFAYLTANLDVTGTIAFRENTWNVHLDNIVVEEDSVDADTPTINTDKDTVNFNISLTRPGDYYEFYVDVVNAGTMDATLDSTVKSTLTGNYLTNLNYNVTYYSDRALTKGDLLRVGCKERIKVRVEYKYDVDSYTKLDDINLFFKVNYIKTDTHASTYNAKVWNFDSKGEEDTFTVPKTGTYKLEVWGAQGGSVSQVAIGGYGGYSVGTINLTKDSIIYINSGGRGESNTDLTNHYISAGGYNGGGFAGADSQTVWAGGGGATHISNSSGLLKTLSSNRNSLLIVSGGGGGASWHWFVNGPQNMGGSGGGYIGSDGSGSLYGTGGTQIAGGWVTVTDLQNSSYDYNRFQNMINKGQFGKGSDAFAQGGNYVTGGGGGAGFYGGGSGYTSGSSAGGGSGYIGNTNLTDKIMYCYNCQSSESEEDETNIKTRSTTNVSATPTSNYAKMGHGYARITFIS